jgi:hypothetical protein
VTIAARECYPAGARPRASSRAVPLLVGLSRAAPSGTAIVSERSSRPPGAGPQRDHHEGVAAQQFTLHRQLWHGYARMPRLARVLLVLALLGVLVKLVLLSGRGEAENVRAAVAVAVREATGPEPASSCSALSPAGLSEVLRQFGGAEATASGEDPLSACRKLVVRLRAQAPPRQLADLARGSVRSVQFRPDGSALVIYLAADRRLGAELTLSDSGGRWLIDSVAGGEIARPE